MQYNLLPSIGPTSTPRVIKALIFVTVFVSLLAALIQVLFEQFSLFPGPEIILSLNWWGFSQGYLWQFFTYFFVQNAFLSFTYLLSLSISMYVFWIIGADLVNIKGTKAFLLFYFFNAASAGLAALMSMSLTGNYALLAGTGAPLLAMLAAWMMAFPENEVFLFFLIPLKAKWLVTGIASALVLVSLSEWNISYSVLYAASFLLGYGYAVVGWGWRSPFIFTARIDSWLTSARSKVQEIILGKKTFVQKEAKIINLQTGLPINEEELFIESMLEKISKYGEGALSWHEKKRMQQVSEKRKNRSQKDS